MTIKPTSPGQPAEIEIVPPCRWITIKNKCRTGSKSRPWILRQPYTPVASGDAKASSPVYEIRGQCKQPTTLKPVSVPDPGGGGGGLYAGEVLRDVLAAEGVELKGRVRYRNGQDGSDSWRQQAKPVAEHVTFMSDILERALRDSQNLFAECLMKKLGLHHSNNSPQSSFSWQGGRQVMLGSLRQWGIDTTGMVLDDGSGLSRNNRASARQYVQVLKQMYLAKDRTKGDLFIASLASSGQTGTMRKRLKDLPGKVWAKTGYLRGVRTMSGFVRCSDETWYAFSILFNDIPNGTAPYNNIHDEVCRELAGLE